MTPVAATQEDSVLDATAALAALHPPAPRTLEEAGLTHGAFYAHFTSREAMLGEAAGRACAESAVAAANAVSLLMPAVEPYFAGAVRRALPHLDAELADTARTFVRQELEHQRQHRRFNRSLVGRFAGLAHPERRSAAVYGWLARTRSLRFSLAFAAASETIAYSLARWTSDHMAEFLRGADQRATDLFVWHLAEEVEHIVIDRWRGCPDGGEAV